MRWIKRSLVLLVLLGVAVAVAYPWIVRQLGGAFDAITGPPVFSAGAQRLIDQAFADIDPARLKDYHVHVIGIDADADGLWVNPRSLSWRGWHHKIKGDVFMNASMVRGVESATLDYMNRLRVLIDRSPVRGVYQLLAFDYRYVDNAVGDFENSAFFIPFDYEYGENSVRDPDRSEFFVPNAHVVGLAATYPDRFVPAISVHPYRVDARERLDHWAERGVRFVKWLPNAQGIDASHPRLAPYYERLRQNNMVLLTHVGKEQAVDAREDQALGNPLRFRNPLDQGVKIIMAHAASLGQGFDHEVHHAPRDNFDLFLRLMDEPKYRRNLFADLSAITQVNRLPGPLLTLLARTDLHSRLVNGSDYPLPAINAVISTRLLAYYELITTEQRKYLNEIYRDNPLLFDFVVKRTLRHPENGNRFPPQVFMMNPALEN